MDKDQVDDWSPIKVTCVEYCMYRYGACCHRYYHPRKHDLPRCSPSQVNSTLFFLATCFLALIQTFPEEYVCRNVPSSGACSCSCSFAIPICTPAHWLWILDVAPSPSPALVTITSTHGRIPLTHVSRRKIRPRHL